MEHKRVREEEPRRPTKVYRNEENSSYHKGNSRKRRRPDDNDSDISRLPFGKHKGCTLAQVPRDYLIWLAGKEVLPNRDNPLIENVLDDVVNNIWQNRSADCLYECDAKSHLPNCHRICLGSTWESTREKLVQMVNAREVTFNNARRIQAWIWVYVNHKDTIEAAKRYLETSLSNMCYKCYKPLTSVGNARRNGKAHDDWEGRRFHKKCWHSLED